MSIIGKTVVMGYGDVRVQGDIFRKQGSARLRFSQMESIVSGHDDIQKEGFKGQIPIDIVLTTEENARLLIEFAEHCLRSGVLKK